MEKEKVRFRLVRFAFETREGKIAYRYMITDKQIPLLEVNQWLETKAMHKTSTAREYGKKLVVFLNDLADNGLEYDEATNRHVKRFILKLIYGDAEDLKLRFYDTEVVCATAGRYLTVITEFYKWLANNYETNITFQTKTDIYRAKKAFLYGQIYSCDYQYILDASLPQQKSRREYIKWYTDAEKNALCSSFETLRDEVVFRITLEGFRIDEVLSMTLSHYDSVEQTIQPTRSKGKQNAQPNRTNHLRLVALPAELCELLNRYIQTERMIAENESCIISDDLFINLQHSDTQGRPLNYGNYYQILKRCAARAGFDPKKIRTHSGRSTKVMEYLEHQALYPEDGIDDSVIMESFGWNSADSILPYRNHNNPVIAKAIMKKIHKKRGASDDQID
jgi:integrase/recombinase XerD